MRNHLGVLMVGAAIILAAPGYASAQNMHADVVEAAHDLGLSPRFLAGTIQAGQRLGLTQAEVLSGLHGIGRTMHEGMAGRDLNATAAMQALGLTYPPKRPDGSPDFDDATRRFADAIARQTDPYTQERTAELFNAAPILPLLRRGGAAFPTP